MDKSLLIKFADDSALLWLLYDKMFIVTLYKLTLFLDMNASETKEMM